MSKSIRIRTTPGGNDNYIKVKLEQDFDFIEVLSLKITQEEVYRKFCADYGAIAGRVIANNGFGVENARISLFIPITEDDKLNPIISGLYPYNSINSRDSNGLRYNLLPSNSRYNCHTPVGSLRNKREVLDNDVVLEIYEKYYKYTTTTNKSGDYLLFGVPTGQHIIHMDVDISDIGNLSQRPYDMIANGYSDKQFESTTKFRGGYDLDSLPQIKSSESGVNIKPFWGDIDTCEIGISRKDFNLSYEFKPSAIFIGSLFSDNEKHSVNKQCKARVNLGKICETVTGEGVISMIRKTINGDIEEFDIEGGRVIDGDGVWAYQIPMNLEYRITDEFGNLVPTEDTTKGIPTKAKVRFKIGMDITGGEGRIRTRANYLVPNNPNINEEDDYTFDETTSETHLAELSWNKLYTVRNFISRYQPYIRSNDRNFIGIKNVDNCGNRSPFPFNRVDTDINPLYNALCLLNTINMIVLYTINKFMIPIINLIIKTNNLIISALNSINSVVNNITSSIRLGGLTIPSIPEVPYIGCMNVTCDSNMYAPGCDSGTEGFDLIIPTDPTGSGVSGVEVNTSLDDVKECLSIALADVLNVFEFEFYNDWINGSLYLPLLKYKVKNQDDENSTAKFCEYDCVDFISSIGTSENACHNNYLIDTCTGNNSKLSVHTWLNEGIVKKVGNELYYVARTHNSNEYMYPTNITSLGSILECDFENLPIIHDRLIPTTYKMAPYVSITDENPESQDEQGFVPLFFNKISCIGLDTTGKCNNIRRACEIGNDIPDINTGDIEDSNSIVDFKVRQQLIGVDTGLIDYNSIDSGYNGAEYMYYRDFNSTNTLKTPRNNSLYYYFGIMNGKSAIDKANIKYFQNCDDKPTNDFDVISEITDVTTIGGVDGSIVVGIVGGVSPYIYEWKNSIGVIIGITNAMYGLSYGAYTLLVTDTNGASVTTSFFINQPQSVNFTLSETNVSTYNGNDGTILVHSITGGQSPYHIFLNKNGNTIATIYDVTTEYEFTNLSYGNYDIIVYDINNESKTISIEITQPEELSITVNKTDATCSDVNNGTINIIVNSGEPPYVFSTTNNEGYNSPAMNHVNLKGGDYTIIVSDNNSSVSDSITIIQPLLVMSTVVTPVSCKDSATGVITVTVSGGKPPYLYKSNNDNDWVTNNIFSDLLAEEYFVEVKDDNGCYIVENQIKVEEPTSYLSNDSFVTVNNEVTFTASGGWSDYLFDVNGDERWVTSSTTGVSPSGTYTIRVKDKYGCIDTKILTIA